MLIFDYSQLAISHATEQSDENLVRHMILNSIRMSVRKYKSVYGPDIVMACDSRKYWREEIFPHYKATRKKKKADSTQDWDHIFKVLNNIKSELTNYSPYRVIEVEGVEGDDIIATLAIKYAPTQKVLILSSDSDFKQLQRFPNISQYSYIVKKMIKEKNPEAYLKEMFIRGQRKDDIPNILSDDDVFITDKRQKSIYQVKLDVWMNQKPEEFCTEDMLKKYKRNQELIDLTKIPKHIVEKVIDTYDNTKGNSKSVFMNYMIQYRLKNLIEVIGDF